MSRARSIAAAVLCSAAICGVRCGGNSAPPPTSPADSGSGTGGAPGPDAGVPGAGADAGNPGPGSDAGNPGAGSDAGNPGPGSDAGDPGPVSDGGNPGSGVDAGDPGPGLDAGAPDGGAGSDGGTPDGGSPPDAGAGGADAGTSSTARYTLTDLGPILGEGSLPQSIDDDGVITGTTTFEGTFMHFVYDTRSGEIRRIRDPRSTTRFLFVLPTGDGAGITFDNGPTHAFLLRGGVFTDLGTLGGDESDPFAMNGRGEVVGMADVPPFHDFYPFLYTEGSMKNLGSLGGRGGKALAINGSGQVTGGMETDAKCGGCTHAFLYSGGSVRDLGVLGKDPNNSFQVGISLGTAINEAGQVAGWSTTNDGFTHVFFWDGSAMIDLGTHPHRGVGKPVSLNIHGQFVGSLGEDSGDELAYVLLDGKAQDLNELVDSHPMSLWHAVSINDSGVIVGTGGEPPGLHKRGFIAKPR